MDKVLLVDKPAGWTSFDVVAKIRNTLEKNHREKTGERRKLKVGHAGTLDPFATGLLVILLGNECKNAQSYLKLDKTYEFTEVLGKTSSTGDPEGELTDVTSQEPSVDDVVAVLAKFTGKITQTPPAYSAIKIDGKRAYKLAREGKKVEIPSREVLINKLELSEYQYPKLKCVCDVGSGTYIRTLVEDIGQELETGAYCKQLRRTKVGDWRIEDAMELDELLSKLKAEQ